MNTPDASAPPAVPTPALLALRVAALAVHFRRVQAERMQGVALLNPALSVEAVGFEWADAPAGDPIHAVAEGVLITPWFMSLLRLPAPLLPHGDRVGRKSIRDFGIERFEFIGAFDPALGYHETCALFSPMNGFTSQALARETAEASLALVRAAQPVVPATEAVPARRAFFMGRPAPTGSPA
ncbi:MAG: [NiFe]-hydrogenase assembly chaperone HybE [Hydrogenophaga sp.]|nr:[NiFe]-hydrogenase assembly chaperone HybE [Hydrogenophaga sp.]